MRHLKRRLTKNQRLSGCFEIDTAAVVLFDDHPVVARGIGSIERQLEAVLSGGRTMTR